MNIFSSNIFHFFLNMFLRKKNDPSEQEFFDFCPKIDLENSWQQSFQTLSKLLTFRYLCDVKRLKKKVTLAILHCEKSERPSYIRYIKSKQPTFKSAFLSEKYLWFKTYESGPSLTFQHLFLNPFQANFFFLLPIRGTIQELCNAKNVSLSTSLTQIVRNKRFVINVFFYPYTLRNILELLSHILYNFCRDLFLRDYFFLEISFNNFRVNLFAVTKYI